MLDMLKEALRSIAHNKLRTALSMIGIIIGVAAVIGVVSVAEGTSRSIRQSLTSIGSNLILVSPGFTRGVVDVPPQRSRKFSKRKMQTGYPNFVLRSSTSRPFSKETSSFSTNVRTVWRRSWPHDQCCST